MTTTHRRRHRLTRIALVTAIAIFSAGGYLSASEINSQLIKAAVNGDTALAEDLLDRGADIETRYSPDRNTALMPASHWGHVAMVKLLLDRGADIDARDKYGTTAIMDASMGWSLEPELSVMELLLDRGADIEARKDNGFTALMMASEEGQVAAVELLLNRGADIEARDDDGDTALMVASGRGHDEVAAVLRAWAAKPGGRQDTGTTLVQSQEPAPGAQAPPTREPKGSQGASLAEAKAQEALGRLDAELALRDQEPAPAGRAPGRTEQNRPAHRQRGLRPFSQAQDSPSGGSAARGRAEAHRLRGGTPHRRQPR